MDELIYVYYGKNEYLIEKHLNEKITSLNVDDININKYDLLENTSDDILEDLRTVSFFTEKKIIVVKNLNYVLKENEVITEQWVKYLTKPNVDVVLLIILDEMIDNKTPIGKAIFNNAIIEQVKELPKDDYPEYVNTMVNKYNYKISKKATHELLERTNNDLLLISQELEKLMLFSYDSKSISEEDVVLLVSRNLEENIYELTNSLIEHNSAKTIEIYYDLMAKNEEPLRVMNNIVGKIRELMHTKLLLEKGYSQADIQDHFNIKSGRAFYLLKNANQVSYSILEEYIKKLATLDYEIKSGKIDKKIGLELFLLGA